MTQTKRDRAMGLIKTMQDMIDRPSTPDGERQAAKSRIAALRAKHDIPERVAYTYQRTTTTTQSEWHRQTQWTYEEARRRNPPTPEQERKKREAEAQEAVRRARQVQKDRAREAAAQKLMEQKRAEAQRKYEQRMRDKDAMGEPLTEAERQEAIRDPLGWAARQDQRTHTQRQQDLNNAWGHAGNLYTKGWNTSSKYRATIVNVSERTSKAGNAMVVIDYLVGNTKLTGYYVLNNEHGLRNIMAVVTTLIGERATEMSVDQILVALQGMICTVMLNSWTTQDGTEKWGVQTVLKPWA